MSELFEANRPRLFGIAYGMLGSVMDAEDTVQDAYLRWASVDHTRIDSPAAYLTTITTRLAIDRLRSARHRREAYVGSWLPEPIITDFGSDPADLVAEAERLSLAVLSALERLNPVERAVLLLRDLFDLDYTEIADVVEKSPANCRQIARRARDRAGDLSRPPPASLEEGAQLLGAYVQAIGRRDIDGVIDIFAEDVILWTDGGGKARAARHPLAGSWRVARHLVGVAPRSPDDGEAQVVRVNGDPGFVARVDGQAIGVLSFEVADGAIIAVRVIVNPDTLAHL